MSHTITLNVIDGALKGERFSFSGSSRILVGRSSACEVRLPNDPLHWDVSRRHCLITTRGRRVTIRDLGSRNGTYVNGRKIGQRAPWVSAEGAGDWVPPPHRLRDGDQIRVGETAFQVEVYRDAAKTEARREALDCEPALVG